jgi:hypothetical protein
MPFQPSDYEMHRALIEQARQRKINARHTKKKQVEGAKKARLKKVPTSALRSEMARRRLAKTPKERREEWAAKSAAQRAIAKHYCDHKKKPPKLRKGGKNAGLYVCPSCNKPVPAPEKPREEIVT